MRFRLTLQSDIPETKIPVNYQYPLSAAIYKILDKADRDYAAFLHATGYGKGFKLFTFSQINCPFRIDHDRLTLLDSNLSLVIAFHLPAAAGNFIKGLFQTQRVEITDRFSKGRFTVITVESIKNDLDGRADNEIISAELAPLSPVVAGLPNGMGRYEFLAPDDARFPEVIIYNWREKIRTCYDTQTSENAVLIAGVSLLNHSPKSRLITIKANTTQQTKIRGWMHFSLKVTAEKKFVELLLNAGAGVYNAQGMGCVEMVRKVRE